MILKNFVAVVGDGTAARWLSASAVALTKNRNNMQRSRSMLCYQGSTRVAVRTTPSNQLHPDISSFQGFNSLTSIPRLSVTRQQHSHHGQRYFRSISFGQLLQSDRVFKYGIEKLSSEGLYYDRYRWFSSSKSILMTSGSDYDNNSRISDDKYNENSSSLLTVSILGPPNAGKSTLFNRLLCKESNRSYRLSVEKTRRKGRAANQLLSSQLAVSNTGSGGGSAIVSSVPGTTRDRRECVGRIGSVYFRLYDTAGIDTDMTITNNKMKKKKKMAEDANNEVTTTRDSTVQHRMMNQTIEAARLSDLVLLLFDGRNGGGVTSDLLETARWLRKVMNESKGNHNNRRRVVICANKLEGAGILPEVWADNIREVSYKLGFGEAIPISALHGDGMAEIAAIIDDMLKEKENRIAALLSAQSEPSTSILLQPTDNDNAEQIDFFVEQENDCEHDSDTSLTEKPLQLAILGRPNVGKSTLVNSLIQSERVLTGATPGLTRDAISIPWIWRQHIVNSDRTITIKDRSMQIVDTAGIRKPKSRRGQKIRTNEFVYDIMNQDTADTSQHSSINVTTTNNSLISDDETDAETLALIEEMAVADALRALKIADVAVLVLDAHAGNLHKHELAICSAILQEGRSLVIVANKMDLLLKQRSHYSSKTNMNSNGDDEEEMEYTRSDYENEVRKELEERFPILRRTPIIAMSSLTGEGVSDLLPAVFHARDRWARKISTGQLNRWLADAVLSRHAPPPSSSKKQVRIKYVLQTKGRPPTFLLFCSGAGTGDNSPPGLPDSYLRFLTRNFQDTFDMYGMEIRFAVKNSNTKGNPYVQGGAAGVKKHRGGGGVGGRSARQKRFVDSMKSTGAPPSKRKRSRSNKRQWK